ncbi:MAG: FtsX-like permease family protein [bacterium]|nr:FtsX-like permease family protein [bacterium]
MQKNKNRPPRLARWILQHLVEDNLRSIAMGDFEEQFLYLSENRGIRYAKINYWLQIFAVIPAFISNSLRRFGMYKNYLKIAFRNIKNHKSYSFINIAGLAIGLACCMLILLFVQDELSYDKFHNNADNIYRIAVDTNINGVFRPYSIVPGITGQAFTEQIPEVTANTRFMSFAILGQGTNTIITYEDKTYEENNIFVATPTFFDIFSFHFVSGSRKNVLSEPGSVVIPEKIAEKIFGDEEAIGKTINHSQFGDLTVTGVIRDIPRNSHFRFDYLFSINTLAENVRNAVLNTWRPLRLWTYVIIEPGADISGIEAKMNSIASTTAIGDRARETNSAFDFKLQKLTDIHLRSDRELELDANGNITFIYVFSAVAAIILIIACINFMNLSTARSIKRAREVGMRKVFGAYRKNLIIQFLSESAVTAFLSFIIALILVYLLLPAFNGIANKELSIEMITSRNVLLGISMILIFVGLFAGSYPALFLSAFTPIKVLRGALSGSAKSSSIRKALVVFQYTISIALIISTFIVVDQLSYMRSKDLGFEKEQILVIQMNNPMNLLRSQSVKVELQQNPDIINTAFSSSVPGREHAIPFYETGENLSTDTYYMDSIFIDWDFIETYGIEVKEGRNFMREMGTDTLTAFIINETAAEKIGWTNNALDKDITLKFGNVLNKPGKIIGVIKDFHGRSLKRKIEPMVLTFIQARYQFVSLRINTDKVPGIISFLEAKWKTLEPNTEMNYFFMDEAFENSYRADQKLAEIFKYFAFLAIFIACLGLFGLASFTAEQKTKEIGIRKVLGAPANSIIAHLLKDFTTWVLLSNIFGWPIAYYFMNKWLQNFAYKTGIGWTIFVISGILALVIAIATVSFQVIKAAHQNPVKSLRTE